MKFLIFLMAFFSMILAFIHICKRIGIDVIGILNRLGNVVCFMTFGFVLPILSNKQRNIFKVTFLSFLCSVTVELIQLVSKLGSCDVDDVILNTLGGFLGYILFCICIGIMHIFTNKKEVR